MVIPPTLTQDIVQGTVAQFDDTPGGGPGDYVLGGAADLVFENPDEVVNTTPDDTAGDSIDLPGPSWNESGAPVLAPGSTTPTPDPEPQPSSGGAGWLLIAAVVVVAGVVLSS